jgi:hypothetical protein
MFYLRNENSIPKSKLPPKSLYARNHIVIIVVCIQIPKAHIFTINHTFTCRITMTANDYNRIHSLTFNTAQKDINELQCEMKFFTPLFHFRKYL